MVAEKTDGPLAGITVLDLTRVLSGPYCTMLLGDMGARVIKVEQPGRGDDTRAWGPPFLGGESSYFLSINRNKQSLTLDFKAPEGRAVLDALVGRADVLVENFRPGTLARQGLDYQTLAASPSAAHLCVAVRLRPHRPSRGRARLRRGAPGRRRPDEHHRTRRWPRLSPGRRRRRHRHRACSPRKACCWRCWLDSQTGRGQHVDVAMLDSVAALLTYQAGIVFATGTSPGRLGNRHPSIAPYDTFETARWPLVLAVGNDDQWVRFCRVAGLDALEADARFATNAGRVRDYDALEPSIRRALAADTRAGWTARLVAAGVPCGPVRTVDETLADAQLAARGMIERLTHPTAGEIAVLGVPIKLSATPGGVRVAPPTLGEHTDAVLKEIGLSDEEIARLRQSQRRVAMPELQFGLQS